MALANPVARLVLELMTMGLQSAAHLEDLLRAASPASPPQELAAEILRCCGRVIALTASAVSRGKKRKAAEHEDAAAAATATCSPPAMPPRKRSRVAEARSVVTSATTTVDGFMWRKYGQKDINGRNHPRLYYRCAYNKNQGCGATRRVQRTQEEPAAYEIAYYGEHTCTGAASCQGGAAAPPPPGVVDFGSNARPSAGGLWTGPAACSAHQTWSWDGDMWSQGGWSSSSASSSEAAQAGLEAQTTHDMAPAVEQPSATPCYAPGAVTEFLDGCFDWSSVVNDVPFGFRALLQ